MILMWSGDLIGKGYALEICFICSGTISLQLLNPQAEDVCVLS